MRILGGRPVQWSLNLCSNHFAINYQLSTVNYQLSTINYQLFTFPLFLIIGEIFYSPIGSNSSSSVEDGSNSAKDDSTCADSAAASDSILVTVTRSICWR